MSRVPWTKFQDFYLRLGFLKVLAAALGDERRSVTNQAIVTKLEKPLFDDVSLHSDLAREIRETVTWYPRKTSGGRVVSNPEVAEALLVSAEHPSVLYGVTHDTAYKILDWGRDVDLVGRGNQITERALVLRRLMDMKAADRFLSGDVRAWNPFALDMRERLFFLFHLLEIDRVTVELVRDLGRLPRGTVLEANAASRATCTALFRVLGVGEKELDPRDIPAFRAAQELACTIAAELDMHEFTDQCGGSTRTIRNTRPAPQMSILLGSSGKKPRRTTKNADHQTVPRFEQLVDLGFLVKPVNEDKTRSIDARRKWRFETTEACRRWAAVLSDPNSSPHPWTSFACLAVAAFGGESTSDRNAHPSIGHIASHLWTAYQTVRRPMGHTPFDSVALYAMISAAAEGLVIEMADYHRLVLSIKKHGLLPNHALFSSGNDLDKMFIALKPGFLEQLRDCESELTFENAR